MAENDQSDEIGEGEELGAPKNRFKVIVAAVVVFVAVCAGGTWFFFFRGQGEGAEHVEVAHAKPPVFVEVPDMLVNLLNAPGERVQYLKVRIVLEVKDEPQVEKIKPTMPRVTDIFQTYLRELRPSDLTGSAGLFRMKEELTRRVNVAVSPAQVSAVLFKEVVVQ